SRAFPAQRAELLDHGQDGVILFQNFSLVVDGDLARHLADRHSFPTRRSSDLTELAGPMDEPMAAAPVDAGAEPGMPPALDELDRQLLHLLTQGSTNREMANEMKLDEAAVSQRLARLLATIGASSRAQATSFAFRGIGT